MSQDELDRFARISPITWTHILVYRKIQIQE